MCQRRYPGHALSRIVRFPESLEQSFVTDLFRVIHDEHDFVVARVAAANLFISRIRGRTGRIAYGGAVHTGLLPEPTFGAPETSEPEHRQFQSLRKRRRDPVAVDIVPLRYRHGCGAARKRIGGIGHYGFLAK